MSIEPFLQAIDSLSPQLSRQELIKEFKRLEAEAFEHLKSENLAPWSKGKGFGISLSLTHLKDRIITKTLEYIGHVPPGLVLLAVGGYGRAELSPYSDIDLLILQKKENLGVEYINQLLYLLWDLGYKLGHSVRTIRNVIDHANQDITFLTAVFESRLLTGDPDLHGEMKSALAKVLSANRSEYARTKIEEIHALFERMGQTVLMKEPNLKENAGGLRSVHVAEWVNYFFNFRSGFEGLKATLSPAQFKRLYVAYDFILYIRNMLHFMCGRKEDSFYINYHPEVAGHLKMKGEELESLRLMMKRVYAKMIDIFFLSAYVVDENYNRHFHKDEKKIGDAYFTRNKEFFIHSDLKPSVKEAMKAILAYITGKYRPSYSFLFFLRDSAKLIAREDRNSKTIFNDFISILSSDNAFYALNVMKLSDFLYRYLKPFEQIRYYIIYNSFHTYTVDEHSLESIRALELLTANRFNDYERSKVADLCELAKKHRESLWILKLTLLFHDIGKSIPGDHSKNGVEIVHMFFSQSALLYRYREVVEFLIENHLLLTEIARRSDIQNIDVILDLSRKFMLSPYPADYLDYLYLITYADVYATNPSNFTGYTATLLMQIYRKTKMALSGKIDREYEKKLFEDKIRSASKLVSDPGLEGFIRFLGISYTNQTSEEEIIADYSLCKSSGSQETRLEVRNFNEYLKVKIYTPDRLGVFACIAGVLLLNGANIVKANIFTYRRDGENPPVPLAFDVFNVTDIFGANLSATSMRSELNHWIERLEKSLSTYINDNAKLEEKISEMKKKIIPTPAIFRKPAHVHMNRIDDGRYLIEISGSDRPALLYDIADYLAGESISILNAIIDTVGWHIQDKIEAVALRDFAEGETDRIKANLKRIIEGSDETSER